MSPRKKTITKNDPHKLEIITYLQRLIKVSISNTQICSTLKLKLFSGTYSHKAKKSSPKTALSFTADPDEAENTTKNAKSTFNKRSFSKKNCS